MNNHNDLIVELWKILNDKSYYSISPNYITKKMNISLDLLNNLLIQVEKVYGMKINKFTYNNYKYIGLESRRIDYENDKKNGTNHIEHLIEQGVYDKPTSGCCIL
jgi:hypothetical protein